MGMIRSVNQSALRPALTPAIGSARRGVSRYFTGDMKWRVNMSDSGAATKAYLSDKR